MVFCGDYIFKSGIYFMNEKFVSLVLVFKGFFRLKSASLNYEALKSYKCDTK